VVFLSGSESVCFLLFVYIKNVCIAVGDPITKKGSLGSDQPV
jgi:hypothetical protein